MSKSEVIKGGESRGETGRGQREGRHVRQGGSVEECRRSREEGKCGRREKAQRRENERMVREKETKIKQMRERSDGRDRRREGGRPLSPHLAVTAGFPAPAVLFSALRIRGSGGISLHTSCTAQSCAAPLCRSQDNPDTGCEMQKHETHAAL